MINSPPRQADLTQHWLLSGVFLLLLITLNVICLFYGNEISMHLDEAQRIPIRSILYGISIILFPVTKLLRHVMLKLNQTMPGDKPAKQRYFFTVAICFFFIEIVGGFGFIMFVLGDNFNTLYIFSGLAVLGIYLHMPKYNEYLAICEALHRKNDTSPE
jgi:hypothetical protein